VARLRQQIAAALMAQQNRSWDFDLEEGVILILRAYRG
jgi:cobalamin biosynthesis protein CobT